LTTAASSSASSPPVVVQARKAAAVVLTAVAAREKIYYDYTAAANVSGIAYERHVIAEARASVNSWRSAGAITKAGAAMETSCARGTVCAFAAADTAVERRADERGSRVTYGNSRTRRRKGDVGVD
jgi:hypothetical protein